MLKQYSLSKANLKCKDWAKENLVTVTNSFIYSRTGTSYTYSTGDWTKVKKSHMQYSVQLWLDSLKPVHFSRDFKKKKPSATCHLVPVPSVEFATFCLLKMA